MFESVVCIVFYTVYVE